MIRTLKLLWQTQRLVLIAFLLALCVTSFFAIRFTAFTVYWADPAHRDVQIEGWMTPGYVARSYRVPRETVAEALALKPYERGIPLAELSTQRGMSLDQLRDIIIAIVIEARDAQDGQSR